MKPVNERLKGRPAQLQAWPGEKRNKHRGLLLWAMMHPARGRSNRAVSRALGVSEGAIRNWRRDGCWDVRAAAHEDSDSVALDIYRREYIEDYGALELPHVAPRVVQPIAGLHLGDPVVTAAHEASRAALHAAPEALRAAEQAAGQAVASRRRDARADAEKHLNLVDASLGTIASKLKKGEVKVSVRDIPILLDCRNKLVQIASGDTTAGAASVVESARVQHAKSIGGDVVEALFLDCEDMMVILGALRSRRDADVVELAEAQAQHEQERERTA